MQEQMDPDDEEEEGTESDAPDDDYAWQGEAYENKDRFTDIPRSNIVQLSCGKYHVFHHQCLMLWIDGQKIRNEKFKEIYEH